jgi:hypothetical protein
MSGSEFCAILLLFIVSSSLLFPACGCQAEHRGGERLERRREDADAAVQQLLVHGAGQEPAAAPAPARPLPRPPLSRHLPAKFIRVRDPWRRGRFYFSIIYFVSETKEKDPWGSEDAQQKKRDKSTDSRLPHPPPPPTLSEARKNYLNEEIISLLPSGIGEQYNHPISNFGHASLLRRCELPPVNESAELTQGALLVNS